MHHHIHLPMEFTEEEKSLVLEYLKKFKHSQLSIKMLMCVYFGGCRYRQGYIDVKKYLDYCLYKDTHSLEKFWGMDPRGKFFGFAKNIIVDGTMNEVEKMITDWLFSERNNKQYE